MKKLFLLDAYALIFRAFYAFIKNPRITSKGINTSAIFGFVLTLEELLQKQRPTHIGVVFDVAAPTFRHILYQPYKATRQATPPEIKLAIPYIKQILEAYHIPIIECEGYEADDIIGTLSVKASVEGFETYMMTPDKDFGQLVKENVFMFKPSRSGNEAVIWGVEDIKREYNVSHPLQIIDMLALMGDKVDNIPGAPGIGPKSAATLIAQYGSAEQIIAHASELKGKQALSIENHKEDILLSKTLATIALDAPIEFNEQLLSVKEPDINRLRELFIELEFRTLAAKLKSTDIVTTQPIQAKHDNNNAAEQISSGEQLSLFSAPVPPLSVAPDSPTTSPLLDKPIEYPIITNIAEISQTINSVLSYPEFCFSIQASSSSITTAKLLSISLTWHSQQGCVIQLPQTDNLTDDIISVIKPLFENTAIVKIGQNLKFAIHLLSRYGIDMVAPLFDITIAEYLVEPEIRHHAIYTINQLFQRKEELTKILLTNGLQKVAYSIEMPLIPVLAAMEKNGIILDTNILKDIATDLHNDLLTLEQDIYQIAGIEFNIASPKQLGDVLFTKMKLDNKAKRSKSKQFTTNEATLLHLRDKSPIIDKVLEYRGIKKLLSTYVDALPTLINPLSHRIHTSFNQTVTATGRLSSTNPNLQNIPIRDERGQFMRKAFVASDGCQLLSADYSQIELRLMAHLSGDKNMIGDFLSGHDIHSATAAKIANIDIGSVSREMRRKAKIANFGIIYGISSFGLAERLKIGRSEAKQLIDGYFISYPDVKRYMDECIAMARQDGYTETILGRRRYLPDITSNNSIIRSMAERNAINAPIQGSAADIIKLAMIHIAQRLQEMGLKSKMILQVHDELIFEVPNNEIDIMSEIVVYEMSHAIELSVPLLVEYGVGHNWLEAH